MRTRKYTKHSRFQPSTAERKFLTIDIELPVPTSKDPRVLRLVSQLQKEFDVLEKKISLNITPNSRTNTRIFRLMKSLKLIEPSTYYDVLKYLTPFRDEIQTAACKSYPKVIDEKNKEIFNLMKKGLTSSEETSDNLIIYLKESVIPDDLQNYLKGFLYSSSLLGIAVTYTDEGFIKVIL
jgi:hypothetical protein